MRLSYRILILMTWLAMGGVAGESLAAGRRDRSGEQQTQPVLAQAILAQTTEAESAQPSRSDPLLADPFQRAIRLAGQATIAGKKAQSQEDWLQVVAQWQQAADLMASIPEDHPRYLLAQERAAFYRDNQQLTQYQAEKTAIATSTLTNEVDPAVGLVEPESSERTSNSPASTSSNSSASTLPDLPINVTAVPPTNGGSTSALEKETTAVATKLSWSDWVWIFGTAIAAIGVGTGVVLLLKRSNNNVKEIGSAPDELESLYAEILQQKTKEKPSPELVTPSAEPDSSSSSELHVSEPHVEQPISVSFPSMEDTATSKTGASNAVAVPPPSALLEDAASKTAEPVPVPMPVSNALVVSSETRRMPKQDMTETLLADLQSLNFSKRRKAIWHLANQGDSRAIQPLMQLMLEADSRQRSLVLSALAEIGTQTLNPLSRALVIALQDEDAEVRKNAIRDLTRVYDGAIQISYLLRHAMEDEDAEVQETAHWALKQLNRIRTTISIARFPPSRRSARLPRES